VCCCRFIQRRVRRPRTVCSLWRMRLEAIAICTECREAGHCGRVFIEAEAKQTENVFLGTAKRART
jgi:hypothetical protein